MTDLIELRMNVAALKRVDPYVKDILETATHVALYTFNPDSNEWAKTDIEGALFVYSRNGEPYNGILIMNRLNTNNLVEPVTHGLELQLHEPFLLYRNSRCDIYGIWFYEKEECIRIATFMSKLLQESEEKNIDRSPLKVKKSYVSHGNNVDIFSMLSKAQENFNTNKEIKKKSIKDSPSPLHNNTMIENIPGGPLMAPLGPDVTSQSVMDFFAKAKVNTRQYKSDQPTPGNVSLNETKPLLARLMSHSSAHTLEHIEKQQRSITPQPSSQSIPTGNSIKIESAASNRCKRRSKVISQQDSILPSTAPLPQDIQPSLIHSVNNTNGSTAGFLRIQSPTAVTAPPEFTNNQSTSTGKNPLASLFAKASSISEDIGGSTLSGTKSAPALIPPTMFAAPSPPEPVSRPLEPLTRNQLLQAFNYLLNSDPDFINKLHEAYVKSFGEMLS